MEQIKKEAIVGIAFGLTDIKVYPFLSSLETTCYKGDVILFVNNSTRFSWQVAFEKLSINVINIDQQLSTNLYFYRVINWVMRVINLNKAWAEWNKSKITKVLKAKKKLLPRQLAFIHSFFFLTISRFFMYYNWLLETDYDTIFFTDVNDVIFQGDVFALCVKDKVVVYEEYDGCSLGNDENNSTWVEKGYGKQILKKMSGSTIICAGTILADRSICSTFLQDFMLEIMAPNKPLDTSGLDQGVLNYMVSHQKKHYFESSKNGKSVFTVALQPDGDIFFKSDAIATIHWAHIPAVVHQYNRHSKLIDFVNDKYFVRA
jgi:hypothetical protein